MTINNLISIQGRFFFQMNDENLFIFRTFEAQNYGKETGDGSIPCFTDNETKAQRSYVCVYKLVYICMSPDTNRPRTVKLYTQMISQH